MICKAVSFVAAGLLAICRRLRCLVAKDLDHSETAHATGISSKDLATVFSGHVSMKF